MLLPPKNHLSYGFIISMSYYRSSTESFHLGFLSSILPSLDLIGAPTKTLESFPLLEIEEYNLRIISSEAPIRLCFDADELLKIADGWFLVCPFSFGLEDFCLSDRCFALPPINLSQPSSEDFEADTAAFICELSSEADMALLLQLIPELTSESQKKKIGIIAPTSEGSHYMKIAEKRLCGYANVTLSKLDTIESIHNFARDLSHSAIVYLMIENERLVMSLVTLMAYRRLPVFTLTKSEAKSSTLNRHLRTRCHIVTPICLRNVSIAVASQSYLAHLCENSYRHSVESLMYNASRLTELVARRHHG